MRSKQFLKNPLISGTLIMTFSGVLSRLLGFFYRIFLSRTIGAEALGIYQMAVPVFALCFALSASSVQTAISRFVVSSRAYLVIGLLLSCSIALPLSIFLYIRSGQIASSLLNEPRCGELLKLISFSLIPCCLHSCINGYYYGKKRAAIPSACQLFEQIARVGSVFIIYTVLAEKGVTLGAFHAAVGLVISEFAGLIFSAFAILLEKENPFAPLSEISGKMVKSFNAMVIPLTLNRAAVAGCQSLENLMIPQMLVRFGYSGSGSLTVYGVLTGMTFSVIMLPGVLTNSLSVLLLPEISEAKCQGNSAKIDRAIKRALHFGMLLGLIFTLLFFFTGDIIGTRLFHNALAGDFIKRLSFLCPLSYITGLMGSILHGLGRAPQVLVVNLLACLIRIMMVVIMVPIYGINAYLWALILSHVFSAAATLFLLRNPGM